MLKLHLLGDQQRTYFHVCGRLIFPHFGNRRRSTLPEVSQQRRDNLRTEPRTLTRGRIRPARGSYDGDRPVVAIAACYAGPDDRAEATIAPLRKWGTIVADQLRPMSYVELQSLFDAARPAGRRCAMRSNFMAALPDAAIEILVEGFR